MPDVPGKKILWIDAYRLQIMKALQKDQFNLGVEPPWKMVSSNIDIEKGQSVIRIDFDRGSTFPCSGCGKKCKVYDTQTKTWRHPDTFGQKVTVEARVPRTDCTDCGILQVEVPWSRSGSSFTYLFETGVVALAEKMPLTAVAEIVGEYDTRLARIVRYYKEQQ